MTPLPPLTRRTKGISLVDGFGRAMVKGLPKEYQGRSSQGGCFVPRFELLGSVYRDYLATADAWKVKLSQ